jgi:hypothetical protein
VKKFLLLCTTLGLCLGLQAQDSLQHRLQIGLELLRVTGSQPNVFITKSLNTLQPFSGLMVRYQLGRWALRAGGNFSRDVTRFDNRNCNDCSYGKMHGYDYSLRGGAQFALTQKQALLYAFADLYYRRYQGEGDGFNPWTRDQYFVSMSQQGIGVQTGLGLQIKLYRSLSLVTEGYFAQERFSFQSRVFTYGSGYNYYKGHFASLLNPAARLYLSVMF